MLLQKINFQSWALFINLSALLAKLTSQPMKYIRIVAEC